ncbi:MAG: hypothetical protein AAGI67_03815 [Pseudomonadota bacterium]
MRIDSKLDRASQRPKPAARHVGWWQVLCLCALLLLSAGLSSAAVNLRETPLLAAQIAYRLDRELGTRRAARQHLLAWRLTTALVEREFAAGEVILEQAQRWETNLQQLDASPLTDLPAWFAPIEAGTLEPLLLNRLAQRDSAAWHPLQQSAAAAALTRLATSDLSPEWVTHQYPQLLGWARDHAPRIWQALLAVLAENPDWLPLVAPVFADRLALPLDAPLAQWLDLEDLAAVELASLEAPVEDASLALLRRQAALLNSEQLLVERVSAPDLLLAPYQLNRRSAQPALMDFALVSLARALAKVEQGSFAELVQVMAGIVEIGLVEPSTIADQLLTETLEVLREVDPLVLAQMGRVDPALGDSYLRLRQLLSDALQRDPPERRAALIELASLRAAAQRHTADLDGYLAQPVRGALNEELSICLDLGQQSGQYPIEPITREQYAGCLDSLGRWGIELAQQPELAGDSSGPFEPGTVTRELALSQWQRINYWVGYLNNRFDAQCGPFDETLVNPLEWSLAVAAYAWFAESWPAYFQALRPLEEIDRLMTRGAAVLETLRRLDQCRRFGETPGRSALRLSMESYATAMDEVVAQIGNATADFRARQLEPEADVRLDGDAGQTTNYRPQDLRVSPCEEQLQCGMSRDLLPSRALLGLLPQTYLIADQIRLGRLSACYGNVRWIDRRGEPTRVGNAAMARYFGRLSFDLHVSFSGSELPIRSMRLTSQDEYEYLFGANSAQVLDNPCPIELVGTQVVSELPSRGLRLVPSRLTFLTAGRADPSQIFDRHWDGGDEWRDRFVTGEGVEVLAAQDAQWLLEGADERLADLYNQWNEAVYQALLNAEADSELSAATAALERERQLLVTLARLLAPVQSVAESATRAALFGPVGLFDRDRARGLARQQVPVNQIAPLALGYLEDARFLFGSTRSRAPSLKQPVMLSDSPDAPNTRTAGLQISQAEPLITNALARLASLRDTLGSTGQN